MSRYIDPKDSERCIASITLKDGSRARCGRRAGNRNVCWQHERALARCCGGNDECLPYGGSIHTADCPKVTEDL